MRHKETIYLLFISVSGALRFLNLGFKDLQAWDEALYTVRAEGILRFGNWIDQSAFAIDGLYSALHPPLHVWLTAFCFSILGIDEFATRLVPALFGFATPFIIYFIGKRIDNEKTGLFAALLFSLNPFVTFFARQGQFDTTMVFFITAGFYFLLKLSDHPARRGAILAGIMVGLALMTKLFVGLGVLATLAIWIASSGKNPAFRGWRHFWIAASAAAAVALPWHMFMTIVHEGGNPFFFLTESALFERTVSGIEGNIKGLEVLYFLNQLLILFPLGVAWFLHGIGRQLRRFRSEDPRWNLVGLWFLLFFVVFSIIRTKLAFYLLPCLVPASLFAAREIAKAAEKPDTPRPLAFLLTGTLMSVLWSWNQSWRDSVKAVLSDAWRLQISNAADWSNALLLAALFLAGAALILILLKSNKLRGVAPALPFLLILPSFVLVGHEVLIRDQTQFKDGATELSLFVERYHVTRLVVAGYERNPQLTYYLKGADIGWREDMSIRRITPPSDRSLFREWLSQEMIGEAPGTLLILEKDKFIRYRKIDPADVLPREFQPVFDSRRYTACIRSTGDFLASTPAESIPFTFSRFFGTLMQ